MSEYRFGVPWRAMTNRHPTSDGREWGALEAKPHPAGGSGTNPPGVSITWTGKEGRATAERIAACVNGCVGLEIAEDAPVGWITAALAKLGEVEAQRDGLLEALRQLRDGIFRVQRAHDCPGFDCATCTPLHEIAIADSAIAKAGGPA